jgi:hypothetical protein
MKISGSLGIGTVAPVTPDRLPPPDADISGQKIEDPLTLSSTARVRAEAATHPRFGDLSVAAHSSAELAGQLAYDFSHNVQQPILDATGWENNTGPLRYAATGEPVTPESEARYKQMAENLQTASLKLYNEERAKGTDSADIFDKLVALGDSQSAEFRNVIDWDRKLS